ncbi:MAG TPA: DEAD/DEAH box helicase [Edaphocola sp.]|nr:DEAD/DEAH box helicase [Edaphocola sp.]
MTEITIHIDDEKSSFILADCAKELMSNGRLIISLKRLRFQIEEHDIIIPFEEKNKIPVLSEIQHLLSKFGFTKNLSEKTIQDVQSFEREERLFTEFAQKAKTIRNDEFEKYPELIKDFETFKDSLKNNFGRKLYPMQLLSAFHMAFSQNACNFAVPGAGKTSIVYSAYSFLKQLPKTDPRHVSRLLVIGPLSSFAPWENEYAECFGRKVDSQRLSGDPSISRERKEEHLYSGNPSELTLIFHGGVKNLQKEIVDFLKVHPTMVVVDEAHRIKNPEGVWGKSAVEIAKEAKSRIVLTGTPVPNGYEDLYNLFQFIYPYKFKSVLGLHYANLIDMTKNNEPDSARVQQFTNNISPFFIRIKKSDLKLPPKEETIIRVEMNRYQREIYDYIESEYIRSFNENPNGSIKDVLNRAKLIRLRQASTNPSLLAKPLKDSLINNPEFDEVDPNAKYTEYSDEFIDDSEFFHRICNYEKFEIPQKFIEIKRIINETIIRQQEKVIIWTIFIKNAGDLQNYLRDNNIDSRLLIGGTPQGEREIIISKFNDPQNLEFQVIIANPFAVAESISLHMGCHNAIYLERDYNGSNFLQSKDRIHRVGLSDGQVTKYYYIVCNDSIDHIIDERLQLKIARMEAIIDEEIPLFTRLNDDDETDIIKTLILDYAQRT